jgi:hypothetical protein
VAASDVALVGEEQVTAQRVQALALVQLSPDSPAEFLVSNGYSSTASAQVAGQVGVARLGAAGVGERLDRSTPAASRTLFAGIVGDGAYVRRKTPASAPTCERYMSASLWPLS